MDSAHLDREPAATPVSDREPAAVFERVMAGLGPFEERPHVAVALSGGADSMAACLLSEQWTRARGGRVTALIVDHGLRAGSMAEVRTVAAWMQRRGIACDILRWTGAKPTAGVQAVARDARYRLLRAWCRRAGVLHLITGHQADDQAETYLLRLGRGSGRTGLAGMSAVREFPEVRLLRPLLSLGRRELAAWLTMQGVEWVDDPSNQETAFARVRLRRKLATEPAWRDGIFAAVRRAGAARMRAEAETHRLLAGTAFIRPLGFARLHRAAFNGGGDPDLRARALGRLCLALGGCDHAPGTAGLGRLVARMGQEGAFTGATLGGCRLVAEARGSVLICREARNLPPVQAARPGTIEAWDGRFRLDLPIDLAAGLNLAPLGRDGWAATPPDVRRQAGIPRAAALTLPALFATDRLVWSPLDAFRPGAPDVTFRPKNSVAFIGFCIASPI